MTMALDPLEYVLNRMEWAAQSSAPAANGYPEARRELLQGIADLRAKANAHAANEKLIAALVEALEDLVRCANDDLGFPLKEKWIKARAVLKLAKGEK
jgi:hypothetical protein